MRSIGGLSLILSNFLWYLISDIYLTLSGFFLYFPVLCLLLLQTVVKCRSFTNLRWNFNPVYFLFSISYFSIYIWCPVFRSWRLVTFDDIFLSVFCNFAPFHVFVCPLKHSQISHPGQVRSQAYFLYHTIQCPSRNILIKTPVGLIGNRTTKNLAYSDMFTVLNTTPIKIQIYKKMFFLRCTNNEHGTFISCSVIQSNCSA